MTRIALLAAAAITLPCAALADPQPFQFDENHTQISATWIHNAGAPLQIFFTEFDGQVMWDPDNIEASSVSVTLPVEGIHSFVPAFDDHLKTADMFEVETWPTATFTSTSVERTGENTAQMTGDLTIKDNTAPVTFDVELVGERPAEGMGGYAIGFVAKTTLTRSEWGLGFGVNFGLPEPVELVISTELVPAS